MFYRAKIENKLDRLTFIEALRNIQEPGTKIAVAVESYPLLETSKSSTQKEAKTLKERFTGDHIILCIPAHHRFFDSFNSGLKQMIEAGLINMFNQEENAFFFRFKPPEEPFKVLTLEELEAGFVVSMAPLIVAIVVFCFEWIVTLKNLIVALCIFQALFECQHMELNKIVDSKNGEKYF